MSKENEPTADFEITLSELEKLVGKLEKGEQTLDESLSGFKHGIELTRQCQNLLDDAQQTVEQLMDSENEGSAESFNADA